MGYLKKSELRAKGLQFGFEIRNLQYGVFVSSYLNALDLNDI